MALNETREELDSALRSNLSVIPTNRHIADIGSELEEIALQFQAIAICDLLVGADHPAFVEGLQRSGQARVYFLERSHAEGNFDDYQLAISRWESIFDCIAANDFMLARKLAVRSTTEWVKSGEYEDDFCYVRFIHDLISGGSQEPAHTLAPVLERWQHWLEGDESVRFNLCRCLLERDAVEFEAQFLELIEARSKQVEEERASVRSAELVFEPRAAVFVEGLALLQIGRRLGLEIEQEYRFCPTMAYVPSDQQATLDIFVELERERTRGRVR